MLHAKFHLLTVKIFRDAVEESIPFAQLNFRTFRCAAKHHHIISCNTISKSIFGSWKSYLQFSGQKHSDSLLRIHWFHHKRLFSFLAFSKLIKFSSVHGSNNYHISTSTFRNHVSQVLSEHEHEKMKVFLNNCWKWAKKCNDFQPVEMDFTTSNDCQYLKKCKKSNNFVEESLLSLQDFSHLLVPFSSFSVKSFRKATFFSRREKKFRKGWYS